MLQPKVSLIVCTKNRSSALRKCLDAISRVRFVGDWELIVVNNQSTDDTQAAIHSFMDVTDIKIRYLFVDIPGNGAGRNAAIDISRGDILAFTDDDCYVCENFLDEIEKVFSTPDIGFASGRILLFDRTDVPITINESLKRKVYPSRTFFGAGIVQGANFAIRRSAISASGMFDPVFGAGTMFSGEDWELALRVSFCGWRGGYFPGPTVYHHHGRKEADVGTLQRFYAVGEGAVLAKCVANPRMRLQAGSRFLRIAVKDILSITGIHHLRSLINGALLYWRRYG